MDHFIVNKNVTMDSRFNKNIIINHIVRPNAMKDIQYNKKKIIY
jgi:hypothetical protein